MKNVNRDYHMPFGPLLVAGAVMVVMTREWLTRNWVIIKWDFF
jgi:prepilin signal peptidase PulO-like enzyme (type II secretory pathway)